MTWYRAEFSQLLVDAEEDGHGYLPGGTWGRYIQLDNVEQLRTLMHPGWYFTPVEDAEVIIQCDLLERAVRLPYGFFFR